MSRLTMAFAFVLALPAAGFAQDSRPANKPDFPPLGHPAGVFGEGVQLPERTKLEDVAKQPAEFEAQAIRLEGVLDDVCQKKGCWMVLNDGGEAVRVRFKDYGFFVPRDATGRRAIVQGVAKAETISEEVAKHYAEEGENPEGADAIEGPQQVISFTATGVVILGSDKLPAQAAADGLGERVAKGEPARDGAGAVAKLDDALKVLRAGAPTWELEFQACADAGEWFVFGVEGGEPYAQAYAVAKDDGRVVRLAD